MNGKQDTSRGFLLALTAFGIFATHDAMIKYLGESYSVFQILLFATLFAFVPLTVVMMADKHEGTFRPNHPWWLALRTILALISASCAFYAFTALPLAEVYALLFAMPLLITALSVPFLGEKVGIRRWMAVLVGFIGVMIVLRPGSANLTGGHAAALTAAVLSSVANIIMRKIGNEERSAVLILIPMITNVLAMAALMPFVYKPVALPDLGIMALIGTIVIGAQIAMIAAYRAAPAAIVAPVQYSQILWAVVFGYLFFDETPDKWVAIGSSVIIASGIFVIWREGGGKASKLRPVTRMSNLRVDTGPSPKPKPLDIAAE